MKEPSEWIKQEARRCMLGLNDMNYPPVIKAIERALEAAVERGRSESDLAWRPWVEAWSNAEEALVEAGMDRKAHGEAVRTFIAELAKMRELSTKEEK